jgi:DNA-binding response OmpR family regulator
MILGYVMRNSGTPIIGASTGEPIPNQKIPRHRILLADDDIHIREFIIRFLSCSGYNLDTVADGVDAWKALKSRRYDLLITDNKMPRMTGLELIKKLRSEEMTLPVILVSGTIPTEEIKFHSWLQIDATLAKPFTFDELLDTVKKALSDADGVAKSAQLSREGAIKGSQILQVEKPANATIGDQPNRSTRILVVDDDNDTRQLSIDVLAGSGYQVEGVKDGAAGWKALQADNNYDLVVTDNKMPNMSGIEMIAKLRSARMTVLVIMATGILPKHIIEHNPWLKPNAMLQRPFSNNDLLKTVRDVLIIGDGNESDKAFLPPEESASK